MSAMEKLVTRDCVAGVVGPYSSACANAVSKLAEKYKVPLLVPVASKEDITRQNQKFVFRLSATTEDYANILISMAQKLGKPKTMAIAGGADPEREARNGVATRIWGEETGVPLQVEVTTF